MLTFTPPPNAGPGSLLQALHEAEAMAAGLREHMAKMVGESPQAIAGIAEAPPLSDVSMLFVEWRDGKLWVQVTTDPQPEKLDS